MIDNIKKKYGDPINFPKIIRGSHFTKENFMKQTYNNFHGKVLDLGAGSKPYKKFFSNKQYESCDIIGEQTYICDSEKIPVENKYYDSVFSNQVFEHIPHPWITIREVNRILKPFGTFVITVPQSEEIHGSPNHFYQYTKYGLIKLVEDAGFKVLKIEQKGKWFTMNAEQFRKACRYNFHIGIFLWPLSEILFPLVGIILDFFEFSGLQGEGWNMVALKVRDLE